MIGCTPSNSEPDIGAIENDWRLGEIPYLPSSKMRQEISILFRKILDQIGVSISYVPGDTILVYPGTIW